MTYQNTEQYWSQYIGKKVRLIIEDKPFPKPKDGYFLEHDDTHVVLKLESDEIKLFLKATIRRVDLK